MPDRPPHHHSYWPERFPVETLLEWKHKDPLTFALQYQNETTPFEGLIFKREWFNGTFDTPPPSDKIWRTFNTWDTAGTTNRKSSHSVGLPIAITHDWHYYILHMLRDKLSYPDLKDAIRQTTKRFNPDHVMIEDKSTGQPAIQELRTEPLFSTPHQKIVAVLPKGQRGGPAEQEWVQTLTHVFAERRVHLPSALFFERTRTENWTYDFLYDVLGYEESRNSDIVVALCQLIYFLETFKGTIKSWGAEPQQIRYGSSKQGGRGRILV